VRFYVNSVPVEGFRDLELKLVFLGSRKRRDFSDVTSIQVSHKLKELRNLAKAIYHCAICRMHGCSQLPKLLSNMAFGDQAPLR